MIFKSQNIKDWGCDRNEVRAGIVHIGVGNFHRAHMQFYTSQLLRDKDQQGWGICGVMLLPGDEKLYRALNEQNGEYTLTVCGHDGHDQAYAIGSLLRVLWAPQDSEAVINVLADSATRIISMTITEGGYNLDKATGEFDLGNAAIQADLNDREHPHTVFGYVACALMRRMEQGGEGITILSCDNLQHNGNTARRAFMAFFRAWDEKLYDWAQSHVTFPNSMVDRITPATLPEDVEHLNARNGCQDKAPVYCEDFIQWVVEDNFAAGRPGWERAGVLMTDDVAAYENMKLSLLNASHTLLSYPSFLAGYRKVDEAMADSNITAFVRAFMDKDISRYVPAPEGIDLEEYKQTLIERFANKSVSDQISRLCFDGMSKFPVYIMPNMARILAEGHDCTRLAFLFAAYRHYLKYRNDDKGHSFEIAEPWLTEHDRSLIASDNATDFLSLSAFNAIDFSGHQAFVELYKTMVADIAADGAYTTLTTRVL